MRLPLVITVNFNYTVNQQDHRETRRRLPRVPTLLDCFLFLNTNDVSPKLEFAIARSLAALLKLCVCNNAIPCSQLPLLH
jgi:hypothetical protein